MSKDNKTPQMLTKNYLNELDYKGFEWILGCYLELFFPGVLAEFTSAFKTLKTTIYEKSHFSVHEDRYFKIETITPDFTFTYFLSFTFTEEKGFFFLTIEKIADDINKRERIVDTYLELNLKSR